MSAPAHVQPIAYTVSCVPEDHETRMSLEVRVEYRGAGRWAVLNRGRCLSASGEWRGEPSPSERTDTWLNSHRFDFDIALALARKHAPRLTVNGYTVADVLADIEDGAR